MKRRDTILIITAPKRGSNGSTNRKEREFLVLETSGHWYWPDPLDEPAEDHFTVSLFREMQSAVIRCQTRGEALRAVKKCYRTNPNLLCSIVEKEMERPLPDAKWANHAKRRSGRWDRMRSLAYQVRDLEEHIKQIEDFGLPEIRTGHDAVLNELFPDHRVPFAIELTKIAQAKNRLARMRTRLEKFSQQIRTEENGSF